MSGFLAGLSQGIAKGVERNRRNKIALDELKLKTQRIKMDEKEQELKLEGIASKERDALTLKNLGLNLLGQDEDRNLMVRGPSPQPPTPTLRGGPQFFGGNGVSTGSASLLPSKATLPPVSEGKAGTVNLRGQQNLARVTGQQPLGPRQPVQGGGLPPERKAAFRRAIQQTEDPKMLQVIVKQLQTEVTAANVSQKGFTLSRGQQRFDAQGNLVVRGGKEVSKVIEKDFKGKNGGVETVVSTIFKDGSMTQQTIVGQRKFTKGTFTDNQGRKRDYLFDQFGNKEILYESRGQDDVTLEFKEGQDLQGNTIFFGLEKKNYT